MSSTEIEYVLTLNTEGCYSDLRRLETSLFRILSFVERMSGDPNVDALINKIQRLIMLARQAQILLRTVMALQAGTLGGPIGWLFAGTQILSMGTMLYDSTRGL